MSARPNCLSGTLRDCRVTFERLATALLFLAIGAAACFAPAQSDTWWQLRTGQEIWTTGTVDLIDHFSYTVAGRYWPNHEWLSQLLFYASYRAGGLPLLTALTASVIVGAWFLIWRLTPGDYPRKHLLCALAVISSSVAWSLRPQVFTLFFVATTALRGSSPPVLSLLPLLFLFWANLHGGVMLGFVILASGVLALLFENRRWPALPLVVTIGCLSATLMTPLGVSIWTEIPASLARLRAYGVSEWRPPSFTDPTLLPFWLLVACFIVLSLRQKPWKATAQASDATFWGALAMLPLAVSSGRNVPMFLLLAVPRNRRNATLRQEITRAATHRAPDHQCWRARGGRSTCRLECGIRVGIGTAAIGLAPAADGSDRQPGIMSGAVI